MKAKVNKSDCIGCGLCTSICPDVFTMDDEGKAEAISGDIESKFEADCRQISSDCPVNAIKVIEK